MMHLTWLTDLAARIFKGRGLPCLFHTFTGLYCPGCGGTRAAIYLMHGQLVKSLIYHPLVPFLAAALIIEAVLAAFTRKQYWEGFNRRYKSWVKLAVLILIVNFAVKNGLLLAGIDLMPVTRQAMSGM